MSYKNQSDQRKASKQHYDSNKKYYLNRNQRYRKELSDYVNKLKEETPCTDCKKHYPYYVMDFDHLDGEQKLGLVSFFRKTGRRSAMKLEIPKCQIVCSNCHRQRTHQRLQNNTQPI